MSGVFQTPLLCQHFKPSEPDFFHFKLFIQKQVAKLCIQYKDVDAKFKKYNKALNETTVHMQKFNSLYEEVKEELKACKDQCLDCCFKLDDKIHAHRRQCSDKLASRIQQLRSMKDDYRFLKYWIQSEQAFLFDLDRDKISCIPSDTHVIIHLHSLYDVCGYCIRSLWNYQQSYNEKNSSKRYFIISSTVEYEDTCGDEINELNKNEGISELDENTPYETLCLRKVYIKNRQ